MGVSEDQSPEYRLQNSTWIPEVCTDHGLLGHVWWLWAIISHTFGVQVYRQLPKDMVFWTLSRFWASVLRTFVVPDELCSHGTDSHAKQSAAKTGVFVDSLYDF